jgi:hypothetical protein
MVRVNGSVHLLVGRDKCLQQIVLKCETCIVSS